MRTSPSRDTKKPSITAAAPAISSGLNDTHPKRCPACWNRAVNGWLKAPDRFHGRSELYELVRCPSCALVSLHDPPSPAEMAQHYGAAYDRAVAAGGGNPAHWKWRRDELLRHKSSGAILDLGCGSGGFLASLDGPSWDLFGIEMSEAAAKRAVSRSAARVYVGDILDAPYAPGSFDVITCFDVLEHLYRPWEVLARISEWLKPGGIFYTMMPNIDSAGARIFQSYWYGLELPRHLHHFSPPSLRKLARSAGLEEVSVTTHREVFIEASLHYILDDVSRKIGIRRTSMALAKPATLPWKVVRKGLRSTILPVFTMLASFCGDGENIRALFVKPKANMATNGQLVSPLKSEGSDR